MLKYGNEIIPDTEHLDIELTGRIYNIKTGETIKTRILDGREFYKSKYRVHIIQVSTNSNAWFEGCEVHHCDENPLNNALSNLVTLTKAEHHRIHKTFLLHDETRKKTSASLKGKPAWNKGQKLSDKTKLKISAAKKGKPTWNKGNHLSYEQKRKQSESMKCKRWWNNGEINVRKKECPSGFVSGRLKKQL